MNKKIYWLENWGGKASGGRFTRSRVALDVADFEDKFKVKVVGLGLEEDYESGKPSWNVDFIIEEKGETHEQSRESLPN